MTYDEAVAFLDARVRWGMRPGLERMAALTDMLDRPQDTYPVIHVSGTNGKYSVVRFIAAILGGLGLRVGTYTSPHVEELRERIEVAGQPISAEDFAHTLAHLIPYIEHLEVEEGDPLTYFELLTAVAFEHLFDQAVHAVVLETGLGGELDATNVADAQVAVVTKVARDHIEAFGDDLGRAAWEKSGIIKEGSAVISGIDQPELERILMERAAERRASEVWRLGRDLQVASATLAVGGQLVSVHTPNARYDDVFLPVHGRHQATNAALAIGAVEAFGGGALEEEGVRQALGAVTIPGRIEVVGRRPLVILDGGHNPDAATSVVTAVSEAFAYEGSTCVLGMLEDKLVDDTAAVLSSAFARFVVVRADPDRGVDPEVLASALGGAGVRPEAIEVRDEVVGGLRSALDLSGEDDLVLVFGSFYTVGAARSWLRAEGLLPQA